MQCTDIEKKLFQANAIMAKIAADYEHITPVTLEDQALFETFFAKEERHTYGNSWIYVTQGVYGVGPNQLGYKYYDGENLCMLGTHPKIEHPEIIMLYWVRPLGKEMLNIIVELSEQIKQKYNTYSYVKKLFSDEYQYLLSQGFSSVNGFPWHTAAPSEDDTFPETIYDRELTLKSFQHAPRSTSLGRVKRGLTKICKENKLDLSEIDFTNKAWEVIKQYFIEYDLLPHKINVSTIFDYWNMVFHDSGNHVEKKILLVNQKPSGVYIVEKNDAFDTTNIYCCFAFREHQRYLMDYLKLKIFENSTTRYINSGGSEDEGMNYFKEKYRPKRRQTMYFATNYN